MDAGAGEEVTAPCCEFANSGHAKACEHYQFRLVQSRLPLPNPTDAGPLSDPKLSEPWRALTSTDLLPWWARHPETRCSERTAKALAWLETEFAPPMLAEHMAMTRSA